MARLIPVAAVRHRDTVAIARWLVGKFLVTMRESGVERRRIVETEAYNGPEDLACHASRGRTKRTAVMFNPGGLWYVYLIYGMHEMLNLVTGPRDFPAAVLIRGVEGIIGPGRVTRQLGINRRLNGAPCARASGLWIEDDGFEPPGDEVLATPRIGVDYAGSPWVEMPWRFVWNPPPTVRRKPS